MCEFCERHKEKLKQREQLKNDGRLSDDSEMYLRLFTGYSIMKVPHEIGSREKYSINYCPMCGRKLSGFIEASTLQDEPEIYADNEEDREVLKGVF